MSGFNYLDLYFDFQNLFKSVKDYDSLEDIIEDAMKQLVTVLHSQQEDEKHQQEYEAKNEDRKAKQAFVDAIKLVYFNYFSPVEGKEKELEPINGRLIYLYDSDEGKEADLKERVRQHMSYYMGPKTSAKKFIRISRALIENETNVRDFVVKNNEGNFELFLNEELKGSGYKINPLPEYPKDKDTEMIHGDLKPFPSKSSPTYMFGPDDEEMNELEHDSEASKGLKPENFIEVFSNPLAAHLVLLEDCSLLYVYSQTARVGSEGSIGYGGVFVLIDNVFDNKNDIIKDYIRFFRMISDSVSACVAHNIMSKRLKNEADKSAKAAIMSRNMSHNLGSHVMAYLKQHLSSVTSILQDNVLAELDVINDLVATKKIEDIALPFLVGVGHFVSYLQERQDFIATIATDYIPYFAEVNFKDAIYDELSPDKRFKRHPRMKNFLPDNILLGNIARSEGLGREIRTTAKDSGRLSDIELYFRDFNGDPVVDNNGHVLSGREDAWESLEEMRRIGVSLPGGVVGRQAVFSILENIIRNAAKHGNWRDKGKLELTIDFIDKNKVDDFAQKLEKLDGNTKAPDELIGDDATPEHDSLMQVLWRYYSKAKDADDLYFVTITDNILVDASSVENLRSALYRPYIDPETQKMDEGSKGIKELRISAAWLRGAKNEEEYYRPLDRIPCPQREKKAPLVYVRQHCGNLQYIFCLQKPRTVAIVLDENTYQNKKLNPVKNTPADNWKVYTSAAFLEENNKSFTFILCENQAVYDAVRPFSSARTYNMELIKSERGVDLKSLLFDGNVLDEEKSKSIEFELYKLLVDDQCKDLISVEDERAAANVSTEADKDASYATTETTFETVVEDGEKKTRKITTNRINGINVIVTDGSRPAKFLYRTHHDGTNEFKQFMDKRATLYKDCRFVESITGNTSTDRLVRNERIDFKWYYSHLHAMKQRIAIFDERMFAKIYGLEEVSFTKGAIDPTDLEKTKQTYLSAMSRDFRKSINETSNSADLNTYVIDRYDKFDRSKFAVSEAKTKDRMGLTYYQMGVSLFTLIREVSSEKENVYSIYGLFLERKPDGVFEPEYNNDDFSCVCAKLAELSWENQGLQVDYIDEIKADGANFIENAFDYISIHQGLLDKLYEAFGIKDKEFDKEKIALTNELYKKFGSAGKLCREDGFVPGLTIHSGRSKPAENDMPQHLPFIQYAAIEHALMDCKYTLVNLLEDARYDKQ